MTDYNARYIDESDSINNDWITGLRVELIATYDKVQFDDGETQEMFSVAVSEDMLKSEDILIDYLRSALDGDQDDLVKLSLCWICEKELFEDYSDKYATIRNCRHRNGKYAFNAWADKFSFKVDTFREFADFDRIVEEFLEKKIA